MCGEPMTLRAVFGTTPTPGHALVDPCTGKGYDEPHGARPGPALLSGVSWNPERLGVTIKWLERQGYAVAEVEP